MERCDVAVEGSTALRRQANADSPAMVLDRSIDDDVAGILERGELLRQRRVREIETVTHKVKYGS